MTTTIRHLLPWLVTFEFLALPALAQGYDAAFAAGDHILVVTTNGNIAAVRPRPILNCDAVALAPGGKRIAYTSYDPITRFQQLYVADAPEFIGTRIGLARGWHRDPSFAPDKSGDELIFSVHINSRWTIHSKNRTRATMFAEDLRTGRVTQMSRNGMCHHFGSYLPDGTGILFTRTDCETSWRIARLDLATGVEHEITTGATRDHQPVASPNGKQIVYAHIVGEDTSIVVADLDGSGARVIAQLHKAMTPQLRWSKDGAAVLWFDQDQVWRKQLHGESKAEILREQR